MHLGIGRDEEVKSHVMFNSVFVTFVKIKMISIILNFKKYQNKRLKTWINSKTNFKLKGMLVKLKYNLEYVFAIAETDEFY
ncbi:MAG: hypothetical protein IPK46_21630 [Saprospiraceae bacterium]|nr:hypothetical protein [Saprospiraceae bacterium]